MGFCSDQSNDAPRCRGSSQMSWQVGWTDLETDQDHGFSAHVKNHDLSSTDQEFIQLSTSVSTYSPRISGDSRKIFYYFNETTSTRLRVAFFSKRRQSSSWFKMYITPIRNLCEMESNTHGQCGRSENTYCVPKSLFCDGVVNCIADGEIGYDELKSHCLDESNVFFNH